MNDHHLELLQYLPAAITGGLVPIVQFAAARLSALRSVHKKRQLRENVIALNAFIAGVKEVAAEDGSGSACLRDAFRERGLVLDQLMAIAAAERSATLRFPSPNAARLLFLLYPPSRPVGWALRWAFFTLLVTTVAGTIRGSLHISYLPPRILVPSVVATFLLAVLVRLAAFFVERAGQGEHAS
jgi:hypothetical protein